MIKRIYEEQLRRHFEADKQMAFVAGPRQVGKTTTAKAVLPEAIYINWDNQMDRMEILRGPQKIVERFHLYDASKFKSGVIFDEIHKYSKWKNFLKGFYDSYGENHRIIVTGSARLNIYKKGGDSLMGRYFLYRMHPLSIAELADTSLPEKEIRQPRKISKNDYSILLKFGGFPEPFLRAETRFFNRWKRLRLETLFNEDIRDLTNIHEVRQIEIMAELIKNRCGQLINYSSLSKDLNVSVDTVRRWMVVLSDMYYGFTVRPWFSNVPKSLRKQPKMYLWDWSLVKDTGAKFENFVASHLLKAVHFWNDWGMGEYELFFVRDKNKREVDFLITKENNPWMLVEAKSADTKNLSSSLKYFYNLLKPDFAFQVVDNTEYIEYDFFSIKKPVVVPALAFLSQLV